MPPQPDTQPDRDSDRPSPSEQVEALSALYNADRASSATLGNERLALLALQLTYLGLAAIALGGERTTGEPWVAAFSAFPLWFMHSYHLILVATSITRSRSVDLLEQALFERSGLPAEQRRSVGNLAGELVHDIARQPFPLRIQAGISYGGIGAVLLVFTSYALAVAARDSGWISAPTVLAGLLYLGLFAASVASWLYVGRLSRSPDTGADPMPKNARRR